ncbi:MAG: hypothetical protein JNL57_06480 [Bacteroidetes bacterium]|nr:hypothetical protein [Bacteroidota bacterium]
MKVPHILLRTFLTLLLLLLIAAGSCRKHSTYVYKVPEYQRQWFFIDSGSYYIYTDSMDNLDSVYVKKLDYFVRYARKGPDYQLYQCTMSNPFVFFLAGAMNQIHLQRSYGGDYFPNVMQVSPPYHANKLYGPGHGFNQIYLDTILNNVSLGNNFFDSTFVWHVKNDNILNSDSTTYYFSKGVGITRITDHERKTDKWLKRYKIIKKMD